MAGPPPHVYHCLSPSPLPFFPSQQRTQGAAHLDGSLWTELVAAETLVAELVVDGIALSPLLDGAGRAGLAALTAADAAVRDHLQP